MTNLYLVFSKPPQAVSAEQYDRWYEEHAAENIVSPGFLQARRFAVSPATGTPGPFTHLAVYEYEGEMERWRGDLNRRIETGEIVLPDWFPQIQFGSWDCRPRSGVLEPVRPG